ncbi:hypothetical protein GOP47_0010928 [Adiantum capillus-veneris]|uniref:F-box domain-containing protein n=1 Tax=Adiantum capillus-veneris TaxID=13818 RepID=A0A9D4UX19_ADICA|nr:hypothetical protein GOP47_0010928 [Adiantum capillus-veneris]
MPEASTSPVLTLCSLVFEKLDGDSLARASCVSRAWRDTASQDYLWKALCTRIWPSLSSPRGMALLHLKGSFKYFYRLRAQAQLQHKKGHLNRCKLPTLALKDLFFLVDISHCGLPISSAVVCGDELLPSFVGEGLGDSSFDFSIPIATCLPRSWSKEEVQEFEVSWAVAARGSQRVFQLMNTSHYAGGNQEKKGVRVGSACTYAQPLPPGTECGCNVASCLGSCGMGKDSMMDWRGVPCEVQVRVESRCSRLVSTSPSGCTYTYSDFQPFKVSFAILHTISWGCLSQAQVLLYLQHALFHQCQE